MKKYSQTNKGKRQMLIKKGFEPYSLIKQMNISEEEFEKVFEATLRKEFIKEYPHTRIIEVIKRFGYKLNDQEGLQIEIRGEEGK